MRKLFIFLIACWAAFAALQAKNLDPEKLKLRSEIVQFLKEEGFVPEVNEMGDVVFKNEDLKYIVSIDKHDSSPFYLSFECYFGYSDSFTKENIAANLVRLNLEKGVKLVLFDDNYCYCTEMYLVDSEAFKYAFYRMMERINGVIDVASDLCRNRKAVSTSQASGSISRFFPLHGITLLATSISNLESMGYQIKNKGQKNPYTTIQGINFYDFDSDGYIDQAFFNRETDIPEAWKTIFDGLDFSSSYNQWLTVLERLGYEPEQIGRTSTEKKDGRKTLKGRIRAISPDRKLNFNFYFQDGNRNGEGFTRLSRNSLGSLQVKAIK